MRIVYLNPCGKLGGAETSLRELLMSVRQAQPDWELWLVLGEDGPLAGIARDLGVRVVVRPFPPELAGLGDAGGRTGWRTLLRAAATTGRYARNLARLVREIEPHLIHTNGFKMHLLGAWTCPRQTPLVWHIHDYVKTRRFVSRLLRLSRRACTIAIVNSKSVATDVESLLPGLGVVPIYNAVDLQRFSPVGNQLDLDAAAGLSPALPGTIRIGLVATFARWKGHEVFLEAMARLSSDVPVRGYIIGAPIYQTDGSQWSMIELQQAAERLGVGSRIGFTGFVQDTAAAIRSLDIVVHASTSPEPFGMVIVEAMACGRAVVVSKAGGAAELFTEGENAVGHRPGEAEGLAAQLSRLVSDAAFRLKLGATGRDTAERFYHGRRLAAELLAVYRQVLGAQAECGEAVIQPRLGSARE